MHIKVKVTVGARKDTVTELALNKLAVTLKAKAKMGEANKSLIVVLSRHFGVSPKKIKIISGLRNPSKMVAVTQDS